MNAGQKVLMFLVIVAVAGLWGLWYYTGSDLPLEKRYETKWRVPMDREVEDPLLGTRTETDFVERFVFGIDWAARGSALLGAFLLGGLVFHALRSSSERRIS
jgi:hypothetical protein